MATEIEELRFEVLMLKQRLRVVELFALKAYLLVGQVWPERRTLEQGIASTLAALEDTGAKTEKSYLSKANWSDAKRAQYADEFREMIEEMKSFVAGQESVAKAARKPPNG